MLAMPCRPSTASKIYCSVVNYLVHFAVEWKQFIVQRSLAVRNTISKVRTNLLGLMVMALIVSPVFAQETTETVQVKVFSLEHADATKVQKIVEELFNPNEDKALNPGAARISGLTTAIDVRTNSIIVRGPTRDLTVVNQLLQRLDVETAESADTLIYRLQKVPTTDVAQAITAWLKVKTALAGEGTSTGECVLIPEEVRNHLIVTTSFNEVQLSELDKAIRALDTAPPMINIDVVIRQKVDGEEKVILSPRIMTIDNMTGKFSAGTETDSITVELTPRVFTGGNQPTKVTRIPG